MPSLLKMKKIHLREQNKKFQNYLTRLPDSEVGVAIKAAEATGIDGNKPIEVWRSKGFLLQVFNFENSMRLSIIRTALTEDGKWQQNITWEELQRLKRECGKGDQVAVEIYPRDDDIVNVANMRHLWLTDTKIGWHK